MLKQLLNQRRNNMGVFEAQLIALAEAMAEQLIMHLVTKVETKLGVSVPVIPAPVQQVAA